MNWNTIAFLLATCFKYSLQIWWDPPYNVWHQSYRYNVIYHKHYYTESHQKIAAIRDIRFMYEVSPHYEMGYVMGEILERYRKIIELTKWSFQQQGEHIILKLNRADRALSLYLELYHLSHMMHEIPQKYKDDPEYQDVYSVPSVEQLQVAQKDILAEMKVREKAKTRERKFNKKMRQAFLDKGLIYKPPKKKKVNMWNFNYGWEIDKSYFYDK